MVVSLLVLIAIAYFGGNWGIAYVAIGGVLGLVDWYFFWCPLIDASTPRVRDWLREVAPRVTDAEADSLVFAFVMNYWRANLRNAQFGAVVVWVIPTHILFRNAILVFTPDQGKSFRERSVPWHLAVLFNDLNLSAHLGLKRRQNPTGS